MMRIHVIQHVPFEDEGFIAKWAEERQYPTERTLLYENQELPAQSSFDLLVVMGGPMNIYEEDRYPWLKDEKRFLQEAIRNGKIILGICLGAQLISDCLGARVAANRLKEIGWYPVQKTEANKESCFAGLPNEFTALHWHGDTFELPIGTTALISSAACQNQAFVYQSRVYALQFHIESTEEGVRKLIENCKSELVDGEYIQTEEEIMRGVQAHPTKSYLVALMDEMASLPVTKPESQTRLQ